MVNEKPSNETTGILAILMNWDTIGLSICAGLTTCHIVGVSMQGREVFGIDHHVWQEFEDVQSTLGDIALAGENHCERAQSSGKAIVLDCFAGFYDGLLGHIQRWVHEGRTDVEQGSAETQCQEPLAHTAHEVNRSCITCKEAYASNEI